MTNNKLFYQAIKADKSDFKIWETRKWLFYRYNEL